MVKDADFRNADVKYVFIVCICFEMQNNENVRMIYCDMEISGQQRRRIPLNSSDGLGLILELTASFHLNSIHIDGGFESTFSKFHNKYKSLAFVSDFEVESFRYDYIINTYY